MNKNSLLLILLSLAITKQAKAQNINLNTTGNSIRITKKDVQPKRMLTCGAAGFIAGMLNKRGNEDNVSSEENKKNAKIVILNLFLASMGIAMHIDINTDTEIDFKNTTAVIAGGLTGNNPNLLYGASAGLIAGRTIGIITDGRTEDINKNPNKFEILGIKGGIIIGSMIGAMLDSNAKKDPFMTVLTGLTAFWLIECSTRKPQQI